jgi:hypothetical protein
MGRAGLKIFLKCVPLLKKYSKYVGRWLKINPSTNNLSSMMKYYKLLSNPLRLVTEYHKIIQ